MITEGTFMSLRLTKEYENVFSGETNKKGGTEISHFLHFNR